MVYKHILRFQSPFVNTALDHEYQESQDRLVKFPEHTPEAFEIYVQWYSHKLQVPEIETIPLNTDITRLIGAYILSPIFQDSNFRDAVIDDLSERTHAKKVCLRNRIRRITTTAKKTMCLGNSSSIV